MKVLILGGRRYLGPRLVKRLVEQGHEPVLFNRGKTNAPLPVDLPIREVHGDRTNLRDLTEVADAGRFDAVVDTLAFGTADAELAIRAFKGKIGRYLVISSVACYGRLYHVPADESHPYVSDENAFPPGSNPYGAGKRDVEQVLYAAFETEGFPVIVIRPSVSYGYGRLFNIWGYSNRHVSRIRAGKPVIVPDSGEGLIQPVFIDDEAEIIERALSQEGVVGEAFNCAGPEAVPLWQYMRAHGSALGCSVETVELPAAYLHGFDPVRCARASENLIFNHAYDVSKLTRVLGFHHRYTLEAGLKMTIDFQDEWGLTEPSSQTDPDDWLIAHYRQHHAHDMQALGEALRTKTGYEPPDHQPLVPWATSAYSSPVDSPRS